MNERWVRLTDEQVAVAAGLFLSSPLVRSAHMSIVRGDVVVIGAPPVSYYARVDNHLLLVSMDRLAGYGDDGWQPFDLNDGQIVDRITEMITKHHEEHQQHIDKERAEGRHQLRLLLHCP